MKLQVDVVINNLDALLYNNDKKLNKKTHTTLTALKKRLGMADELIVDECKHGILKEILKGIKDDIAEM